MAWIDALFKRMVEVGASDLHMTSSTKPQFRLHGDIVPVKECDPIPPDQTLSIIPGHFFLEKRIVGCMMGSNRFHLHAPQYLDLYRQGRLDLDSMVSRTAPLDEVEKELNRFQRALSSSRDQLVELLKSLGQDLLTIQVQFFGKLQVLLTYCVKLSRDIIVDRSIEQLVQAVGYAL